MADPIRVLIVDDHAVVREGLRAFLELQDRMEVVGEAGDGREAIEEAERLRPDVILMDLVMPRLDGVEAMRELHEQVPAARVIVLTSFLDDERLAARAPRRRCGLPRSRTSSPRSSRAPSGRRRRRGRDRPRSRRPARSTRSSK